MDIYQLKYGIPETLLPFSEILIRIFNEFMFRAVIVFFSAIPYEKLLHIYYYSSANAYPPDQFDKKDECYMDEKIQDRVKLITDILNTRFAIKVSLIQVANILKLKSTRYFLSFFDPRLCNSLSAQRSLYGANGIDISSKQNKVQKKLEAFQEFDAMELIENQYSHTEDLQELNSTLDSKTFHDSCHKEAHREIDEHEAKLMYLYIKRVPSTIKLKATDTFELIKVPATEDQPACNIFLCKHTGFYLNPENGIYMSYPDGKIYEIDEDCRKILTSYARIMTRKEKKGSFSSSSGLHVKISKKKCV